MSKDSDYKSSGSRSGESYSHRSGRNGTSSSYQSRNKGRSSHGASRSEKSSGSVKSLPSRSQHDSRSVFSEKSGTSQRSAVPQFSSRSVYSEKSDSSPKSVVPQSSSERDAREDVSVASSNRGQSSEEEALEYNPEEKLNLSELLESLNSAVKGIKHLDSVNVLKEMHSWKQKAGNLEEENISLKEKITELENKYESIQSRARRYEKRLQEGRPLTILEKHEIEMSLDRDTKNASTLEADMTNDDDDDESSISVTSIGPSDELKKMLGTSFRNKWNRRKIAGLESEAPSEDSSVGEETAVARKYIDEYMEDQKLKDREKITQAMRVPPTISESHDDETMTTKEKDEMEKKDDKWMEVLSI